MIIIMLIMIFMIMLMMMFMDNMKRKKSHQTIRPMLDPSKFSWALKERLFKGDKAFIFFCSI